MKISLKEALAEWDQSVFSTQEHLPVQRLYEMGQTGGFKSAAPFELEHLSLCPACLDHLGLFSMADEAATGLEEEDVYQIIGYGFLKAAAAGLSEPVEAKSSCKNFILSIYPEVDSTSRGMAVLTVARETDRFDGLQASVRDASCTVILKSTIVQGRAAVKIDFLDRLDLSEWTIILSKNQEPETA